MSVPKFRRRKYFINKEFQGRAIFHYFLLVLAGSVLFSLIFSFFSSNTLSIVYEDYHLNLGTTPQILLNRIFSSQWLFVLIGGTVVTLITLLLTHRTAGPIYNLENKLDKMLQGDIDFEIRLRKKDEAMLLAEKINHFNRQLAEQLAQLEEINTQTAALAARLEERGMAEVAAQLKENTAATAVVLNSYTYRRDDV